MNENSEIIRHGADGFFGSVIVASIMGWLPPLSAALGIVWFCLQIYGWVEKRVSRKKQLKRRASDV